MCKAVPNSHRAAKEQSIIWKDGDEVCLRIARRKNRPNGSGTMRRKCTCKGGQMTCAIHMLWEQFFEKLDDGEKPWAHIAAGTARSRLRQILCRLDIKEAGKYGTQDFRRGHAEAPLCFRALYIDLIPCRLQDMRTSGCTLAEILLAGQWKSIAFLKYLDEVCTGLLLHLIHIPCFAKGGSGKGYSFRCGNRKRRGRMDRLTQLEEQSPRGLDLNSHVVCQNALCWHWCHSFWLHTMSSVSALGLHSPGVRLSLWRGGPRDTNVRPAWADGDWFRVRNLFPDTHRPIDNLCGCTNAVGAMHKFRRALRVLDILAQGHAMRID